MTDWSLSERASNTAPYRIGVDRRGILDSMSTTPYLSVSACCGYDAEYLREWIEFHRLVGVERFFLYNNGDRDVQRELLEPYVEDGLVVLHEFPGLPVQVPAFEHCLVNHREDARWIAFIDTDEFLFAATDRPLRDVLAEYEEAPGVGVCRAFFGPSGRRTKPPGLVIESYLTRIANPSPRGGAIAVKSVIDPKRSVRPLSPHGFEHSGGHLVDERHRPIEDFVVEPPTLERLRINHYWTRSEEELHLKFSRKRADTGEPYVATRTVDGMLALEKAFGVPDETILRYVAPLRERLAETRDRYGSPESRLEPSLAPG
jgi:hypothetical protein